MSSKPSWIFGPSKGNDSLMVYSTKACLCAHIGMQQWGIHYWEIYTPVVNWISFWFLLIVTPLLSLETKALDFVLALLRLNLIPLYTWKYAWEFHLKVSIKMKNLCYVKSKAYVVFSKLPATGMKLKQGLKDHGFRESLSNVCIFIWKVMIILEYFNDCILISKEKSIFAQFIDSLTNSKENFVFTDNGTMDKYLGVDILIQQIHEAMIINPNMTKSVLSLLLGHSYHVTKKVHLGSTLVNTNRMLGYLQGSNWLSISMVVHQCAPFNTYLMLCQEKAVKQIAGYLLNSANNGIHYKPDSTQGLEVFVDADFAGGWSSGNHSNPEWVLSHICYVIMFTGCPITWSSKLQTEIALSTMETEYIEMSQPMRKTIPCLNFMQEIGEIFYVQSKTKVSLHNICRQHQLHKSHRETKIHAMYKTYCYQTS